MDAIFAGPRLHRLGVILPALESQRLERGLAAVRALLVACALLAVRLDPLREVQQEARANALLIWYLFYALTLLLVLRAVKSISPKIAWPVHIADILWAAAIGLFTGGPETLFFGFYLFVLVAAGYRWGLHECLLTIGAIVALLIGEAAAASSSWTSLGHITLNGVVVRSAYVVILGVLVGQIAEQNKRLRGEAVAIARLIRKARVEAGMRGTMHGVISELLHIVPARQMLLALWDSGRERLFLWTGEYKVGITDLQLELEPRDNAELPTYFPGAAPHSYHVVWKEANAPDIIALDTEGQRIHDLDDFVFPARFREAHQFRSLASVAFNFAGEWQARLFLVDPHFGRDRESELRFFHTLIREANPAVYNVYLLRTLRQRASAMERARVARELHDGAIQSLISVEMQMDVLRRRASELAAPQREAELKRLQGVVHNQVLELRELMQQMKPVEVGPQHMPDFLADLVERFRRDTGIDARFVSELDEVKVPPRVARELARIVQEALANIRRHSGARNAIVHFGHGEEGGWKLVVDDDGRGFDFNGTWDLSQLDQARKGPLVIKERVRAIGADMKIDSVPGRGARLEIRMPRKAYAAHR